MTTVDKRRKKFSVALPTCIGYVYSFSTVFERFNCS